MEASSDVEVDWSVDQFANHIAALIWLSRPDGLCTYFNKNWLAFVGRAMDQELGNGWTDNIHPDDLDRCLAIYTESVEQQTSFRMKYRLKRFDGEYRWILDDGSVLYSDAGEFLGFVGTCLDITDEHDAKEIVVAQRDELKRIVMQDHLTKAFNRHYLYEHVALELERSRRYHNNACMLLIDIDNFKDSNDEYGHIAGDNILRSIVACFKQLVRPFDIICRLGGDEFCIILVEIDLQEAYSIAERVRVGVEKLKIAHTQDLTTTVSIGLSQYKETLSGIEEWIDLTDNGLYQAKHEGRNKVCIADYPE